MVKVMPKRDSGSTLPKAPRAAVAFLAAALLLVNTPGIAHAALQEASSDDSSIFSTDIEVLRCAVRVLNVAAQPDLAPKLLQMVAGEGLPESVDMELLEVLCKLDQHQPVFNLAASDNSLVSLHNSL